MNRYVLSALAAASLALAAPAHAQRARPAAKATPAEAARFVAAAERELADLNVKANRAQWVSNTYITDDTEELSAEATQNLNVAIQRLAMQAKRFDGLTLAPELRRKLTLLKLALVAPPPGNPSDAAELTKLTVGMEADYGKGTYCRAKGALDFTRSQGARAAAPGAAGDTTCLQLGELSRILATSRNPDSLLDAWAGWHTISRPMRQRYARFVELSNKGARELGFANTGAMWRAGYDMPPDQFAQELERLWQQVQPLYVSLHAYVRQRLVDRYGPQVVQPDGLIPADLLGNMWAQEWGNIYDVVAPPGAPPTVDITALLARKKVDAVGMAHYADDFFQSLGFAPLPKTFWERSMLVKPRDREVVCHASAWDIDDRSDVRVKACLEPTGEDFITIHHEEGHNFYQRAYSTQPFLFRGGANDGFHEAIGDAIALSITPSYLKQVGLLDTLPSTAGDTAMLLRQALDKVAFLPFGLLIDQWRWKVFSGEITPADYNASWWALREKYQGIAPPLPRSEADFDPAAKFHVAANVPYTRYFLARILQFQFYRALCREAGYTGPLYRCSFFGSKTAGAKLAKMLEAGASRPWQETLFEMTGERDMDASALMEYFAPLKAWLDQQNAGKTVGWKVE